MEKIFGDQNSGESQVMATILQLQFLKKWAWNAVTCAHFVRGQICVQVKAIFFTGHPTQVNTSFVTSINLLLAIYMFFSAAYVYLQGNLQVCLARILNCAVPECNPYPYLSQGRLLTL